MEKSEPTLVPEWLKNSGSSNDGGSVSHLDDRTASRTARNKPVVNSNGHDFGWSSGSNTTSSYFRRSSSSNGSNNLRSYNSFGRNQQRDKEWTKDTRDRNKLVLGDHRHPEFSDSQGNTLSRKFESDGLRRSQSMISDKRGDNNGLRTKGSPVSVVNKTTFERDFPSLGAEEKAGHDIGRNTSPGLSSAIQSLRIGTSAAVSGEKWTPGHDIGRNTSPGLSSAIQSLRIGTSAAVSGEKWTSALAEVPVLVGSNEIQSSKTVASGTTSSLNMAKAVAQGPSRAQTPPELSVGNRRLEQLAIKQSRQLIPVTPSMPKTLVVNTSDKHKTKAGLHQHPVLSPVTQSPRGGTINGNNVSKSSSNIGKLHILNPVREKNGVPPVMKDTLSPTNGSKTVNSTNPATPSVSGPTSSRAPQNKPMLTVLEKRPTSQAKSRNEFFNSVRKKSMPNSSSDFDSATPNSSPVLDKLEMEVVLVFNTGQASGSHLSESEVTCNGDTYDNVSNGKHPSCSYSLRFPEEEETAFLRLLGWKEDSDEGGLTEEEINAYYTDIKTKLSTSIQNHP